MDKNLNLSQIEENLRNWFKEKWVRFGPDGKIRGECARGDDSEGKPKCLPQAKAHALGKKGRKYAASKKRREDPNPERRGSAKNVATKKKSNEGVAEGKSLPSMADIDKQFYELESQISDLEAKGVVVGKEHPLSKKWQQLVSMKQRILRKNLKKGVAEGLNEMDKSAPQPGRDGKVSHSTYGSRDKKGSDYFKGKEAPGKPITKKQMEKDTLDILKKQGVAKGLNTTEQKLLDMGRNKKYIYINGRHQHEAAKKLVEKGLAERYDDVSHYASGEDYYINPFTGKPGLTKGKKIYGGTLYFQDKGVSETRTVKEGSKEEITNRTVVSLETHYQNGYDAQKKGRTRQDNPHREGTPAAAMWAKGWEHASDNRGPQQFTNEEVEDHNDQKNTVIKNRLIGLVARKHNLGSAELNLLTIEELKDLLDAKVLEQKCPECKGPIFHEDILEGKDACYYKVKSRYKVWPSAYASGALVKCRKKGAKNWGNKSESVTEASDISGLLSAASLVKDYIVTAIVDGKTKRFRIRGVTGPNAARERFLKHVSQAEVLSVSPEGNTDRRKKMTSEDGEVYPAHPTVESQQQKDTTDQTQSVAATDFNNDVNLEEAFGAFLAGLGRNVATTGARQAAATVARQAPSTAAKSAGRQQVGGRISTIGGIINKLTGPDSAGDSSTTVYCVVRNGEELSCFPNREEAENYRKSLPDQEQYAVQSRLQESQISNIDKKLYYKISGTSEETLINEFKMQKDTNGWFLPESATNRSKLDALRTFGLPIVIQEGYDPTGITGGTGTIGSDNVVSPVGSVPKSQRINNKKQGKKNG